MKEKIIYEEANPNIGEITNGSTLTIQGNGSLYAKSGNLTAAIGSGYSGVEVAAGDVANIIINSGNITAIASEYGNGIGGGRGKNVNNIIINGGNIFASSLKNCGIGASEILENLTVNGGNIIATGGEYGGAIGGYEGSKNIVINGGYIEASTNYSYSYGQYYALGHKCEDIIINGGTLNCYSKKDSGIYSDIKPVKINGGNIYSIGGTAPIGNAETKKIPINNNNEELYLTKIKLEGLNKNNKIDNIKTSDNLKYGITDMYTLEEGIIYLYLPLGERIITVESGMLKYEGSVKTTEEDFGIIMLTKK